MVSLLIHPVVLQISDMCIYFKSLWQAPVALIRLGIKLEIQLHLPHLIFISFIIFLVNYTAHMFNYLSVAAMYNELFTLLLNYVPFGHKLRSLHTGPHCGLREIISQWNVTL